MTQQPYGGYPAQPGYAPPPQQPPVQQYPPQYPQAPAPPAPQQYAPPGYAPQQGYAPVPQQPPAPPLASGTIDDYYSQPSSGGGPSISWSHNGYPKPEGTSYAGIVARDVTNADIQQQTDPKTGQPKFYRDGRPQFVMKVPLQVQPSQEFPDGEATLFVRGQMRDELVRAMGEQGLDGAPRAGDGLSVTLVSRKPSRGGGMPQNVFAISYGRTQQAQGAAPAGTGAPSPAPVQVEQPQAPQQVAQPQYQPAPVQQYAQAPAPAQVPQQAAPAQPGVPQGMDAEQAALFARITGQQPGAPAA
jgi:hypothetical protein